MSWLIANWEWILLGMYLLEKIVKLSPTTKDDVIFDMILNPIFEKIKSALGKK